MPVLLDSDRDFQLWRAVVGHHQLLLRSTKTAQAKTRIDVWFKPVSSMKIRMLMHGLRIRRLDAAQVAPALAEEHEECPSGASVYLIESQDFRGYVIADLMRFVEDDGEYWEPSPLMIEQPV